MDARATQAPRTSYHRDCARATDGAPKPPTFADKARQATPRVGGASTAAPVLASQAAPIAGSSRCFYPTAQQKDGAQQKDAAARHGAVLTQKETAKPPQEVKPRYPPLVVEKINNWTAHFKKIAAKLGRPPNGRPYGQGIRFTPEDEKEYRLIQAYLYEIEKEENISWFAYSLPADKNLKVAIRGLPVDTDPEEIKAALEERGFFPEYIKNILGRQGRPGCVFFAEFKKKPDLIPALYQTTELLYMPGITIEAWRPRKGVAQCHRCQLFRHSSHACHRRRACVKCGEPHAANECPRPREEPATCANCGGAHPANFGACPVLQKETRNKKAGTLALTAAGRRGAALVGQNVVEETAVASLMAPARDPNQPKLSRRAKKNLNKKAAPAPAPASPQKDSLGQTIGVLKGILEAVQSGTDAETATLMGLMKLLNKNGQ